MQKRAHILNIWCILRNASMYPESWSRSRSLPGPRNLPHTVLLTLYRNHNSPNTSHHGLILLNYMSYTLKPSLFHSTLYCKSPPFCLLILLLHNRGQKTFSVKVQTVNILTFRAQQGIQLRYCSTKSNSRQYVNTWSWMGSNFMNAKIQILYHFHMIFSIILFIFFKLNT